ncbi:MAG: Gfo/Idh/MocA family oxidoreductase [Acidobacteriota bacterium]
MDRSSLPDRRKFLKHSARALAFAAAGPTMASSSVARAQDKPAPSDRVVVGLIGCGDLGRRHHLSRKLLPNPRIQVAAVCDVDRNHRDEAAMMVQQEQGRRVGVYSDFRRLLEQRDLDAVMVVTPDHWHALIAIAAMETGRDVYCEKPLSLTIEEGKAMVAAARRYGSVFQTGSQQRSDRRFRQACELVRNGKIGKLSKITTHIGGIDPGQWQPAQTPPPELDWNFWLGPAPYADYFPNRCHYQFRWFLDYSGGKMTDWGAHHNDIAQWALGADESGPVEIDGHGEFYEVGPHDIPGHFEVTYRYANGVELVCQSEGENGVKFYGSEGWIFVNRGKILASDPGILQLQPGPGDVRLYESEDHHTNWLDCIQSRKRCICDVEIGHRSVTVCHLGNISMRLGRPLKWDPVREQIVGDLTAQQLCRKPMRAPWHL